MQAGSEGSQLYGRDQGFHMLSMLSSYQHCMVQEVCSSLFKSGQLVSQMGLTRLLHEYLPGFLKAKYYFWRMQSAFVHPPSEGLDGR